MSRILLSAAAFQERWSQLHGGAEIKGAVKNWLRISYQVARICSTLRLSPNFLTFLGVVTAVAMTQSANAAIALLLLVLSLFFDGVDGSVAIAQGRESRWGAFLDAVADRISEACWLYVGWRLGIPAWLVVTMWSVAATQEYARARMSSLGHSEIGVVTITERPVRAIFMAFVLTFFILDIPGTLILSYAFLGALIFSFFQVMRASALILR